MAFHLLHPTSTLYFIVSAVLLYSIFLLKLLTVTAAPLDTKGSDHSTLNYIHGLVCISDLFSFASPLAPPVMPTSLPSLFPSPTPVPLLSSLLPSMLGMFSQSFCSRLHPLLIHIPLDEASLSPHKEAQIEKKRKEKKPILAPSPAS